MISFLSYSGMVRHSSVSEMALLLKQETDVGMPSTTLESRDLMRQFEGTKACSIV
jgi:hypothetical protein